MSDRGLAVTTEEVHIRMCAHDISVNLLYHLSVLSQTADFSSGVWDQGMHNKSHHA